MTQNNYAINMIVGFIREIGRTPHRIFHEVPIRFGASEALVSVVSEPQAIVATLADCPLLDHESMMHFINETFRSLSGYRATIRFTGDSRLNKYADDHLHHIDETWLTEYRSLGKDRYSLEVFRCVPRKEIA